MPPVFAVTPLLMTFIFPIQVFWLQYRLLFLSSSGCAARTNPSLTSWFPSLFANFIFGLFLAVPKSLYPCFRTNRQFGILWVFPPYSFLKTYSPFSPLRVLPPLHLSHICSPCASVIDCCALYFHPWFFCEVSKGQVLPSSPLYIDLFSRTFFLSLATHWLDATPIFCKFYTGFRLLHVAILSFPFLESFSPPLVKFFVSAHVVWCDLVSLVCPYTGSVINRLGSLLFLGSTLLIHIDLWNHQLLEVPSFLGTASSLICP